MKTNRVCLIADACMAFAFLMAMTAGVTAVSQAVKVVDSTSAKPVIEATKDSLKAYQDSNNVIKKQIVEVQSDVIDGNKDLRVEVKKAKALYPIIDQYVKYKSRLKLDISEIKKQHALDSINREIVPLDSTKNHPKPKKKFRIFH